MQTPAFFSPQPAPLSDPTTASGAEDARITLSAEQLLQLQVEVLGRKHFTEAATALAQQLAVTLHCERASLGWREADGMRMVAASYVAEVHTRQETARLVTAAMDEAAEQGVTLIYPDSGAGKSRILLAHEELARRQGYALCTVPLVRAGTVMGALTLERRHANFTAGEIVHIEHMACMITPVLDLKYENGLSLWRRGISTLKAHLHPLLKTGAPARKPVLAGIVASFLLLGFILLFPVTYRVSAPAHLEGSIQRVLTAPTDGFLYQVHARPGDRVKAGQVLAELADQDMRVEQRGLETELAQHENALISAQVRGDRNEFIVSQGRADAARAKLDLIQQQLDRSHLRAPFDGIVIKGDLSQSIGAPVERGAELITLAPDSGYRIMIEAEENEVAELKSSQTGWLTLAAMPAQSLAIRVERITPLATTENGRHYFAVYATLGDKLPGLRPGLQGIAKIEIGRRPLLVSWVSRTWNWLRFQMWSWGA